MTFPPKFSSVEAVTAEMKAMKVEAQEKAKKKELEEALMPKLDLEHSSSGNVVLPENIYQRHDYNYDNQDIHIELER